MTSNGYGQWWPGANDFLVKYRGKITAVKMITNRWEGGVDYEVRVEDPGATGSAYEEGEGERGIWACHVAFTRGPNGLDRFTEAAREQERIAREIAERFSAFGPEAASTAPKTGGTP